MIADMEKKFLVVANWKANKTVEEARAWMKEFYAEERWNWLKNNLERIEVVFAAPFTLLHFFEAPHFDAHLASQDISVFSTGPYTGEVPAELLKDLAVRYCLIGHSERRKYFGENNALIEKKLDQAIKNDITPIICAQSLEEIPANIRNYPADKLVIMYEPSEAISTEGNYHPENPETVKRTLEDWQKKLNLDCRFLYGGSVNPENCKLYIVNCNLLSGFVVGHASLDPEEFFSIIKQCILPLSS